MTKIQLQMNPRLDKSVQWISGQALLRMEKATSAKDLLDVYNNAVKKLPGTMAGKLADRELQGCCLGLLSKKGWKKEADKLLSDSLPSPLKNRIMKN